MFNLNEKYFPISEWCGRNHQNKILFTSPKETFSPWELNGICIFKMNLNTQYEIINIWIYVFFFFDYENKILFYHHIKSGVKSHRLSNLILLNPLKPVSTVVEYGKSRMIHVISQVRKLMLKEIEFGTENNLF